MQLVASIAVLVIGLILALVVDVAADLRFYGWVLVGIGVLGLVIRWTMARLRDRDPPSLGR
jgi:hypothetical protein